MPSLPFVSAISQEWLKPSSHSWVLTHCKLAASEHMVWGYESLGMRLVLKLVSKQIQGKLTLCNHLLQIFQLMLEEGGVPTCATRQLLIQLLYHLLLLLPLLTIVLYLHLQSLNLWLKILIQRGCIMHLPWVHLLEALLFQGVFMFQVRSCVLNLMLDGINGGLLTVYFQLKRVFVLL